MRIAMCDQPDLFGGDDASNADVSHPQVPDIVRIMDIQQEQLARSLGEGHRVIHGVAGSGKTLILGYRAEALAPLAKEYKKPILILCFNTSLAAKLSRGMAQKKLDDTVHVYHFHEWCSVQLKTYQAGLINGAEPIWERHVLSVIAAVDKGRIPRAQYSGVLIDEGHDFEPEWIQLITQMIDSRTNSLLFLYDDAQSIYQKKSKLGFSLSSVGVKAQGRTSILRLNYRNTREILDFTQRFARDIFTHHSNDDVHILEPEAAGSTGQRPTVHRLSSWQGEVRHAIAQLQAWHSQGYNWADIGIVYSAGYLGKAVAQALRALRIPHLWMASKVYKKAYNPSADKVTVLSIQSSKGLEFPVVMLIGAGGMKADDTEQNAKLLYVGMTRAQEELSVCYSGNTILTDKLFKIARA